MLGRNEEWAIHCIKGELYHEKRAGNGTRSKPISVRQLMDACADAQLDSGWLPECVRREGSIHGKPFFLAYFPPGVQESSFANGRVIRVHAPGMVLLGHGKSYSLLTRVDGGENWDEDMAIVPAPLPNVHPNGSICFGGNAVPQAKAKNALKVWDLFWKAPFNSDLSDAEKHKVLAAMLQPEGGKLKRAIRAYRRKTEETKPGNALMKFLKQEVLEEEDDDE